MSAKPLTRMQQLAIDTIRKTHGEDSVLRLGDKVGRPLPVISSGVLSLDMILCVSGGFPLGRMIELYGPEGGGKSTLSLHTIAQAQKAGYDVALIDAEHALDVDYATALGVNVHNLFVTQPDSGEQGLEVAETWMRCDGVNLIVIDSIDALVPRAVLDGDPGDAHVAPLSRLMSQNMRRLCALTSKSKTCFLMINQIRTDLQLTGYGATKEKTSGGRALKHYASIRLEIKKIGQIKDGEDVIGHRAKIQAVKNKVAAPYQSCEVDLIYGKGLDAAADLLDLGVEYKLIKKSGAWYSRQDSQIGQGRAQAVTWIRENPETAAQIATEIKIAKGILSKE